MVRRRYRPNPDNDPKLAAQLQAYRDLVIPERTEQAVEVSGARLEDHPVAKRELLSEL
jgi:hypothetical protein